MKRYMTMIAIGLLATACTPAASNDSGMMQGMQCCEKMKGGKECPCCKDMKEGKECCCKGMKDGKKMCDMKEGMKSGQETKKPLSSKDHQQHHSAQ